jgi:hypothetical protein
MFIKCEISRIFANLFDNDEPLNCLYLILLTHTFVKIFYIMVKIVKFVWIISYLFYFNILLPVVPCFGGERDFCWSQYVLFCGILYIFLIFGVYLLRCICDQGQCALFFCVFVFYVLFDIFVNIGWRKLQFLLACFSLYAG